MEAVSAQLPAASIATVVADDEILRRRLLGALRRDGIGGGPEARAIVTTWGDGLRSTIERVGELRGRYPGAPVVLVAADFDLRDLPLLLEAGVAGIVLERELEATVASAVKAVACGQVVFPAARPDAPATPLLSTREKQVLGLVVLGCTNAEIAATLHVAETTVKSHLTSVFRKLGVRSRSEACTRVLDPRTGLGVGVLTIADPADTIDLDVTEGAGA